MTDSSKSTPAVLNWALARRRKRVTTQGQEMLVNDSPEKAKPTSGCFPSSHQHRLQLAQASQGRKAWLPPALRPWIPGSSGRQDIHDLQWVSSAHQSTAFIIQNQTKLVPDESKLVQHIRVHVNPKSLAHTVHSSQHPTNKKTLNHIFSPLPLLVL